ncbi:MAG: HD domain-containing phosphohydrolase [Candidatus Omnitrophota bacterium]
MAYLERGILELLSALPDILELSGSDLLRHSFAVAFLSKKIANEIVPHKVEELFLSGLVHDIGTFDMPYETVHKADLYCEISDKDVLSHPLISGQIISSFPSLSKLADIVIAHHERFDGKGYPLRRSNNEVSSESQTIRIADSLSVKFNHSKKLQLQDAYNYLDEQSGKEFNPVYLKGVKSALDDKTLDTANNFDLLSQEIKKTIDSFKIFAIRQRRHSIEEILFFFGQLLDIKHSYSESHCIRVSNYAVLLALGLGLESKDIDRIRIAGMVHDLGKIGIPKNILDKPARLTEDEFKVVKSHPDLAVKIISKITSLKGILPIVKSDQEHWDGSGYPQGLKGEEIPFLARIMLVADAFDAMTSDRAYRKAMPLSAALAELERCKGKDFDPRIIEVAMKVFSNLDMQSPPSERSI